MDLKLVLKLPGKGPEGYGWVYTYDPKRDISWSMNIIDPQRCNNGLFFLLGETTWKPNIDLFHPAWGWTKLTTGMLKSTTNIGFWQYTLHFVPWFYGLKELFDLNIFEPFLTYCMLYWNPTGHYVSQASLLTTFIILSNSNTLTMDALTVTGLAANELHGSWRWVM